MRFLKKNSSDKFILVISDLHLGAGLFVNGQKNDLEDFTSDRELVDFLNFFSTGENEKRDVHLIINGDFLDLLAVPFVPFFDDEFFSEEAALAKLNMILEAHSESIEALVEFSKAPSKRLTYIIGNHDGELVFPSLRDRWMSLFPRDIHERIQIFDNNFKYYYPHKKVAVIHGHEYEPAHHFHEGHIVTDPFGKKYFKAPWGSYYVVAVINKFKAERKYINSLRPAKKFLLNGLFFDTLFTIRFIMANMIYFFMVRFIFLFKEKYPFKQLVELVKRELQLFRPYEDYMEEFFHQHPEAEVLICGHTHAATFDKTFDNRVFINTGTWTRNFDLSFSSPRLGPLNRTFAMVQINKKDEILPALFVWKGFSRGPYEDY